MIPGMTPSVTLRLGGVPPSGTKALGGLLFAALVVFVFWGSPAYPEAVGLVPHKVFSGLQLWRVVSAPLWFGPLEAVRIAPFVLSLIGLLLFGGPLERWLSTWRLVLLFTVSAVSGHLGAALVGLAVAPDAPLGGPAPGVWGVVVALGILYWQAQVVIVRPLPVQGRHLVYGLGAALGIALLVDLADGLSALPFLADGIGALVGAAFVTRSWRFWSRRRSARSRFVLVQGGQQGTFGHFPGRGRRPGNGRGHGGLGTGRQGPRLWN